MNSNSILIKPPILNACFNNNYNWCKYTCQRTCQSVKARPALQPPTDAAAPAPKQDQERAEVHKGSSGTRMRLIGKKYINRENKNWTLE